MDELKDGFIVFVIIIAITLTISTIVMSKSHIQSYGQHNEIHTIQTENAVLNTKEIKELQEEPLDLLDPFINITYPSYPPTLLSGNITLRGITNDSNGIMAISADAHTFPFNGTMPLKPSSIPSLISEGNWSKWSIPFAFNQTGTYRIVVTVRDNADNLGYAETTVNVVLYNDTLSGASDGRHPRIAFVRSTFTEAAYQENGFYTFYFKHGFPPVGKNITADLDMLTVRTPKSVLELLDASDLTHLSNLTAIIPINGTELHDISYDDFPVPQKFWIPFINHVKKVAPDSTLTVMRDEDVHDGHIFTSNNNINAYDVLLLFHNEYVTQTEYDNLKQFVANGGTIVFIDANALYAEVSYDKDNDAITLINGHNWKFDGKVASRSVSERWYNETKEWVGSNYLVNAIEPTLVFTNNLFNYTHFEEQFVNNPKAKIIIDYGVKFPADYVEIYSKKNELPSDKEIPDVIIATYLQPYGKGKVIGLGLTARNLAENQVFMKFFEDDILPKALCPKFIPCYSS